MPRYFIKLSYNGSRYNGWQIQDNTPNTIQQVLEEKLSMLFQQNIEVTGCGRTDTGVHAKNYIAHFDLQSPDLQKEAGHWIYKLNCVLPDDISVLGIQEVDKETHARFDAVSRTYHYYLNQKKDPFLEGTSWYLYGEIDFELMNEAARILLATTDFSSFSKLNTQVKTNNCKVTYAKWEKVGDGEWRFVITSDRFLRNMVRAIVGTLIDVGRKKIDITDFENIIKQKSRTEAGMSAPAHALFLTDVKYPEDLYL